MTAPRAASARRVVRARLGGLVASFVVVAAGCSRCRREGAADGASDVVRAPAPVPAALLLEGYISSPDRSWTKLQRSVGGALGILPATVAGLVATASGVDASVAQEVDGLAPAYAVVAGDLRDPDWVLALRLADPARARRRLIEADVAPFTARPLGEVTELLPKAGRLEVSCGIAEAGFVVVGRRSEALSALAGYATRTLPSRSAPLHAGRIDVPPGVLGEVVAPNLAARWADAKRALRDADARARRERGRSPDYGDPEALVRAADAALEGPLAVLRDLASAQVALDVEDDGVELSMTLAAASAGGPASAWLQPSPPIDARRLLRLPLRSALAASLGAGGPAAADAAPSPPLAQAIFAAFAPRMRAEDRRRLEDHLQAFRDAKPGALDVALAWDQPPSMFLRVDVEDPRAAARATRGITLLGASPFREMARIRQVTVTDAPRVDGFAVAEITRDAPPAREPLSVAFRVAQRELVVAAGRSSKEAIDPWLKPPAALADEPALVRRVDALGAASALFVVQPLRLDPERADLPFAPLVLSFGRRDERAILRAHVADALLRELTRRLTGL